MKNMYFLISFLSCWFCSVQQAAPSKTEMAISKDTLYIPAKITMVTGTEPGEAMLIWGTIYLPDGKTPAKGAILSVWHTDDRGFYIAGGGGAGELHPRIH